MVRSMYSGVTGMKSHQTKLDVIGNNIANVNTYGFKSSRATFRDVYYQSLRNAAAPTGNAGGTNPSGIGYGSSVASVDLLMTQSTVSNTGNPMDVAINGDGFFQVQDADGNTFYTRAGMLDIDADGNLVDMNGYFVLGVAGNPLGQKPASNKINILNTMGSVPATKASATTTISNVKYTFTAGNATPDGNVNLTIGSTADLPYGVKAKATVGSSNINVMLNANETFATEADLMRAINDAIKADNKGIQHPAGEFTLSMDPAGTYPAGGLKGKEIAGTTFGYIKGSVPTTGLKKTVGATPGDPVIPTLFGGFEVLSVGDRFSGATAVAPATPGGTKFELTQVAGATGAFNADWSGGLFELKVTPDGGKTYTATLTGEMLAAANSVIMTTTGDTEDTITMKFPSIATMLKSADKNADSTQVFTDVDADNKLIPPGYAVGDVKPAGMGADAANTTFTFTGVTSDKAAVASVKSKDLGLGSQGFRLQNGTEGGQVQTKDLTGIVIGADGIITASHGVLGTMEVGRIDIANFNNSAALIQSGNSYYSVSANSGDAGLSIAGTGGVGNLKTSSLELSNVDLSQEFADMITTQRGFQANSRMITVSDTLLEELVNLKR